MDEKNKNSISKIFSQMDAMKNVLSSTPKIPGFGGSSALSMATPTLPPIDRRSRAEIREDFEKELAKIDKIFLENLKDRVVDLSEDDSSAANELWQYKEDLENSLVKFIRYIEKFEDLNSEESRKVALKERELKLEGRNDWAEKSRTFFFRILASALFIATLFAIGYIEKEYEWATLPLSKYVQPIPPSK